MGIFERISYGWRLAMTSMGVVREHRSLMIFPIISTIVLFLVLASFAGGIFAALGFDAHQLPHLNDKTGMLLLFLFYLVSYFIIIFFNLALIHCAMKVFNGEEPAVSEGIAFSFSKIGQVLSWALVSATVGFILRLIEDKNEFIASIVAGLFGMLWSVLTFFVVPVMAYEGLNVFDAIKRSGSLLKSTWGERVGENFAFGLVGFLLFLLVALPLGILVGLMNPLAGIIAAAAAILIVSCFMATANTVFQAAVYQYAVGKPAGAFAANDLAGLFSPRTK